jgi:hypothetical protein
LKKKKIQERKDLEIVLIRDRGLVEVAEGSGVLDGCVPSCMRCTSLVWNSPSVQTFLIICNEREERRAGREERE